MSRSDVHSAEPAPDGETLSTLLHRYGGAGEPLSCEPLSQGLLNRGYRLATTRGRFFLKHHLNADRAAIAYQHRVTLRLGALGVPVAPPVVDADGHTVTVIGGRCYALHPWIDGRHRDGEELSASQSWRLGALLGLVHTSLEQVIGGQAAGADRPAAGSPAGAPADSRGTGTGAPDQGRGAPRDWPRDTRPPAKTGIGPSPAGTAGPGSRRPDGSGPHTPVQDAAGPGSPGPAGSCTGPEHPGHAAPDCAEPEHAGPSHAGPGHPGLGHAASGHPGPGHAASSHREPDCAEPDYAVEPDPRHSADPEHTYVVIERLLALARAHRPRDAFDELAEHRLIERRALVKRHAHRRPETDAVPATGWVHGDFHPLNLLYRDTEPAAILDWDRLGLQPRAEEVVRAAAIFFVRPGGTLNLAKIRRYARAYRCAAGTGSAEMAAAVHRVWWERINDFWMLRWRYRYGDRRADPQFPAVAALAVWWTREYTAVRDAFCD